jgi:imidazolonepropionase-like amidohydrolase
MGTEPFFTPSRARRNLKRKWPQFLATKPDFVKTYLLFSEDYAARTDDSKYFGWKGMDPALLRSIVQSAHAAGLPVSTHIESAADFHNALMAGVDEINPTPGFRVTGDVRFHALSEFQIPASDAKYAARHGVFLVTTLAEASQPRRAGKLGERDELNRRNLAQLKKYHVRLALGSDSYGSDTVPEAL